MAGLPISIGSVGVRIVPDMRGFETKIDAFTKTIRDINIGIDVDSLAAMTDLTAINELVDHLDGRNIDLNVDVNHEGLAAAELGITDLMASIDDLTAAVDGAGGGLGQAGMAAGEASGGFSMLGVAIGGLIVFAGPLVAVVIPALVGLGTVVASVTAGLGVFALAVAPLAKAVEAFRKAQLDPTTANLNALKASLGGMPGAGRGLVLFIGTKLWPAFQKIQRAAERGLFPGLLEGLRSAMPLVQPLTRFVGSLARTLGDLAAQAGKALNDKFWRGFFAFVSSQAGPTLKTFGKIIGEVAVGVARMFEALGPLTKRIGKALLELATRFANWTASASFQKFIDYITNNGPQLISLFEQIARLAIRLAVDFAPLGSILVQVTTAVTRFLSKLVDGVYHAGQVVGEAIGTIGDYIVRGFDRVVSFLETAWSGIKKGAQVVANFFTGPFLRAIGTMGSLFITGVKLIADAALAAFGVIVHGAADALGWVPGLGGKLKHAESLFDSFRTTIDQTLSRTATQVGGYGRKIGTGLGDGILTGLTLRIDTVTAAAHGLGWAAAKAAAYGAQTKSPSRLTIPVGEGIADGITVGVKHKMPSVQDVVHAAGASVPQSMADGINQATPKMTAAMGNLNHALSKEIDRLKSDLASKQSELRSLASSITSNLGGFDLTQAASQTGGKPGKSTYLDGIGWVTTPGTDGASTYTASGILGYLDTYSGQEQRVLDLLNELSHGKHHLTKKEVSTFEQEPVAQSLPILQALSSATPGQLRNILGDISDINSYAKQAGTSQAQDQIGPRIDRIERRLSELIAATKGVGPDVGREINGAAHGARQKGVARQAR